MIRKRRPWVVVLAGGDDRRLDAVRVDGRRLDRPKQFCRLPGTESMLQETLRRAEGITDRSRILAVVRDDHRHWWLSELCRLPKPNVLAQTDDRGTGVAILHALVQVLQRDGDPTLVILPSDHAADDEAVLRKSILLGAEVAADTHEHLLLLGLTPEYAECEYGWIVPDRGHSRGVRSVTRFVEKPGPRLAAELFASGALWNSCISAVSGHALLELFEGAQPLTLRRHLESLLVRETDALRAGARSRELPPVDFSRDIIQVASIRLRVLVVPPCGWTNLGTPRLLERWRRRHEKESSMVAASAV